MRARSLSSKLLWLTILFVMIAEVLIFVPSVANMRVRWLEDRLNTAAAAAVVIDGLDRMELPVSVRDETLMATGTKAIVLRSDGTSRIIVSSDMPPDVAVQFDLHNKNPVQMILDAFEALAFGGDRAIRVVGPVTGDPAKTIDLVLDDTPLRTAMFVYARNVFFLSILISFITAGLVFFAINRIMIKPVRRMTENMQAFSGDPENPARVIAPRGVRDELGLAEGHLAEMQTRLQETLREQKHLADLGLAVSKINHDMRNILTSAQLMSDRLAMVDDPMVKRFAPKLLRTIDRAVAYSGEVLAYGKAREAEPTRRRIRLKQLCTDICELVGEDKIAAIDFEIKVADDFEIDADSEQLFRALYNLVRNAAQALSADAADPSLVRRITLAAETTGGVTEIRVCDTGPGLPKKARENLFQPFRGSARSGGTGLGLAIARELVLAHGGTIELVDTPGAGADFRIRLPLQAHRPGPSALRTPVPTQGL